MAFPPKPRHLPPLLMLTSLAVTQTQAEDAADQAAIEPDATERGELLGAKMSSHPAWFKESFLDIAEDVTRRRTPTSTSSCSWR
jgi:hypothetical protein